MALDTPTLQPRSMSKRWSSIITQPSSFLRQQASDSRRESDMRSASSSADRRSLIRSKRESRIPSTSHDDPWEIRCISCCAFDRIRRTHLPDHDKKESDWLFRQLATVSSQSTEDSRDTSLNATAPVPRTPTSAKSINDSPPVPAQAAQVLTSDSLSPLSRRPPPRPLKSSRRVSLHHRSSSGFVHENSFVDPQELHDSLRRHPSYLPRIKTPPLDAGMDTRSLSSSSELGDTASDNARLSSTPSPVPSYKLIPATPESNGRHDRSIWMSTGYAEQLSPLLNKGPTKPSTRLSMPLYLPPLQQAAPPLWM